MQKSEKKYSIIDKLIYSILNKFPKINLFLFDLEKLIFINKTNPVKQSTIITGLARCGSTILLKHIHELNIHACLTYQDMPFVVATNLFKYLPKKKYNDIERAHNDGLMINSNSAEAFENVFWKMFEYKEDHKENLSPKNVTSEVLKNYEIFKKLICLRYKKDRYLTKNNNFILKINSYSTKKTNDKVIVLFREPLAHALSLQRLHKKFEYNSKLVNNYLLYLGHHEFGQTHIPFKLNNTNNPYKLDDINYWLHVWVEYYSYLISIKMHKNILIICYERLCMEPTEWKKICSFLDINSLVSTSFINKNKYHEKNNVNKKLLSKAKRIYKNLSTK